MPSPTYALGDIFYCRYEGENIQGHLEESRLNQGPKEGRERKERQKKAERQKEGAERTTGQENKETDNRNQEMPWPIRQGYVGKRRWGRKQRPWVERFRAERRTAQSEPGSTLLGMQIRHLATCPRFLWDLTMSQQKLEVTGQIAPTVRK